MAEALGSLVTSNTITPSKRKVDHEDSNINLGFGPDNKRGRVVAAQKDHARRSRSTISPSPTPKPARLMTTATVPSTRPGLKHENDLRGTSPLMCAAPYPSSAMASQSSYHQPLHLPILGSERPSTAWYQEYDALLMRLRSRSMDWASILGDHFLKMTPETYKTRYERLMEELNQQKWDVVVAPAVLARAYRQVRETMWKILAEKVGEEWQHIEILLMEKGLKTLRSAARSRLTVNPFLAMWDDGVKLEAIARAYIESREMMWNILAEKVGEKWQHIENLCMDEGLKTLTSAAPSTRNKDLPRTPHDEDDDFHDSGLAPDPIGSDAGNPDPQSGSWFQPKVHQAHAFADVPNEVLSAAKSTPLDAIQDIQTSSTPELNYRKSRDDELQYISSSLAQSGQTLQGLHDTLLADYASLHTQYETMHRNLQLRDLETNTLLEERQRLQKCVDSLSLQLQQRYPSEGYEDSAVIPKDNYSMLRKVDDLLNGDPGANHSIGASGMTRKVYGQEDEIESIIERYKWLSKQRDIELAKHREQELSWQIERDFLLAQIESHFQSRKAHFALVSTDYIGSFGKSLLFLSIGEMLRWLWNSIIHVDNSSASKEGLKHLSWTCICGYKSIDYFQELRPGAVADYATFLHQRLRKIANPGRAGPGNIASLALRSIAENINLVQRTPSTSDEERQELSSSDAELLQMGSPSTSVASATTTSGSLYLLLCLPYKTRGTKLVQPDLEKIQSDQDFFRLLRSCYSEIRGRPRSMLSLRTPRRIKFVQFELRRSQLVNIRRDNDVPPENYKNDYIYKPMPAEMIPPLGENYMMHLYAHPDHADASAASDLEQVPKKLKQRLCVGSSEGKSIGWGVHFIESWHYNLIWLLSFAIALLASFVFFVCWAVLEHDVQGASGVAAYVLALATLLIGSVQAAFEMEIL